MVVRYHGLPDSIVNDRESFFISKFWSLLCYFFSIKRRLIIVFYLQTNGQNKRQNSSIKAYLQAFVNFKQNDWAWLLSMAEFAYNNTKNASIGYIPFELNYKYHLCVFYEENLDLRSKSRIAEKLSSELQEFMIVCQQNLYHVQKLQKRGRNKRVKPQSYAPDEKVWLSSKYLKTKRNCKLEAKFFGLFQVLYPGSKQVYKFKLPKK